MTNRGRFITLEGGEGVGKSTLIAALGQRLRQENLSVVITREPGGTPMAESIRELFKGVKSESILPETELCLISAARAQHVAHRIRPALSLGHWVICDRFADSSRVYQGHMAGLDRRWVDEMIHHSTQGLEPDLTLLLDAPIEISLERLAKRKPTTAEEDDGVSRFDNRALEFHERLREGYLALAKEFPKRIVIVDATKSSAQIIEQAWSLIHG